MPSYGENQKSLSHLGLNRHRVMTDRWRNGQTDRWTELP